MQILTVREYLINKSLENVYLDSYIHNESEELLTKAFLEYIQSSQIIKYGGGDYTNGFFMTKLRVKLLLPGNLSLKAIYDELVDLVQRNGLKAILINKLMITPEIIDSYGLQDSTTVRYRGIIASIKYVH